MMNQENQTPLDEAETNSSAEAIHALLRFLRIILHRKMYVVAALFVAGLLGGLYYFTATRIYQASAQLLILQSGPDVWSPNMSGENRQALIPTYERLFSSAVVLDGALASLIKGPAETRVDFAGVPRERWVKIIQNSLTANAIRRTNVIEISYRSKSPVAAEAVVAAVVQSYLQFMDKNHKDVSAEIVTILEQERSQLEVTMADKQQTLLEVQRRVRDLGISDNKTVVHPAVQRVVRLNESLVKVQQDRLQLEATLTAVRGAVRQGSDLRQHLATIEPILGREMMMNAMGMSTQDAETRADVERRLIEDRAKLDAMLQHYGDAHPAVTAISRTIANSEAFLRNYQQVASGRSGIMDDSQLGPMLISMVEERLAGLWEHESQLMQLYQQAEGEAVQMNDRMAELRIAEHDLQRLRNLHDTLLNRIANIDIGKEGADVRVAVVSEPKALAGPVAPRLSLVGILCVVSGLGIGVAAVYILDVLDDRFRSPEELQEQLGVPVLAMIRELSVPASTGPEAVQVHLAPESVESEAFRTLRTTLAFSGQDLERIAITSTEPGDGKTTVLANLGVSYAHAGKRTLLIDCDLRKPGLTKLFEFRGQAGASDILRSDDDIGAMCQQRIQSTGIDRLDLLPCGPKPPNPAELLSGSRLADLLAWAEAHYDQVLIDCPPILAASDAAIVGRLSDTLVLVIQPEKNHRRLVFRAVSGLAAVGVNIGGIVANKISTEKNSTYYGYGGYGYGYGYGSGYGTEVAVEERGFHDEAVSQQADDVDYQTTATASAAESPLDDSAEVATIPFPQSTDSSNMIAPPLQTRRTVRRRAS